MVEIDIGGTAVSCSAAASAASSHAQNGWRDSHFGGCVASAFRCTAVPATTYHRLPLRRERGAGFIFSAGQAAGMAFGLL